MSKINDLRVAKIAKVLQNYATWGDEFMCAEEVVIVIDEILDADSEEEVLLVDDTPQDMEDDDEGEDDEADDGTPDEIPEFLKRPKVDLPPAEDDEEPQKKPIDVI